MIAESLLGAAGIAGVSYILRDSFQNFFAGLRIKFSPDEIREGDQVIIMTYPKIPERGTATVEKVFTRRTVLKQSGKQYMVQNRTILENPVQRHYKAERKHKKKKGEK